MKTQSLLSWKRGMILMAVTTLGAARGADFSILAEGDGIEVAGMAENARAFNNRTYVFREVPPALAGMQFVRGAGGAARPMAITARQAGELLVAVGAKAARMPRDQWTERPDLAFSYTDNKQTRMTVHSRAMRAGERIILPFGGWTGALAMAPAIETRLAPLQPDHGHVPGAIITYSPQYSGLYIGSPGIAILPDGSYLAKCDYFGPGSTQDQRAVSPVFRSRDRGATWAPLAPVEGMFWASIFVWNDAVYLMGTDKTYGNVVIRRSDDGGETWTDPVDGETGLLLADGKYHTAPMPHAVHNGRIWRAMEDKRGTPDKWGEHFRAFMMSAPVDADLLKASSWTVSNALARNPDWLDGAFGGWLEGNAIVTPQGRVVDLLRVDMPPERPGVAAIVEIDDTGRVASFDPATGFIDLPGGCKKFSVRFDETSGHYWSIVSWVPRPIPDRKPGSIRNVLALARSADLRRWEVRAILLRHPDVERHGFQYVDWLFDGDDLVAACRTAYEDGLGGARNHHDANYLTFHRVPNFRTLTGDLEATKGVLDR